MRKITIAILSVLFMFSFGFGLKETIATNAEEEKSYVTGVNVTLTDSIAVNYYVENAENFSTAVMKFEYLGKEKTIEADIEDGKTQFSFEGLAPQYMTETVNAVLTLKSSDGNEYVEQVGEFSVKNYIKKLLLRDKEDGETVKEYEAMRTLAVNLLYYGDAAQKYVAEENGETVSDSELASSVLTAKQSELKSTIDASELESLYVAPENNDGDEFRWVGYGARFDSKMGVYFEFVAKSVDNLEIIFNGETKVAEFERSVKTVGERQITVYKAINDLYATDYSDKITAKAYISGVEVGSPISYGVSSLVKDFESGTKEYNLALAAVSYGQAAKNYAGEKAHVCEFVSGATEETNAIKTTKVNSFESVPTGTKVVSQKLAKVCKYCGKISETSEEADIVYDIDENLTNAKIQGAAGSNVPFAVAKAQNGNYAQDFTSRSGKYLRFGLYSDTAKTITLVLKASSGYTLSDSGQWGGGVADCPKTAKTGDMQLNKVFSATLNGESYAIADDIVLYGDIATGGDNYKVYAHWTFVPFTLTLDEGINEFVLTADVANSYKDNGGSASSPRIDSVAIYASGVKLVGNTAVNDGDTHYRLDLVSGEKVSLGHEFENIEADNLLSEEANCRHGNLYFKSCECGAKSTETFDDGNKTEHTYVAVAENGEHYQKCSVCGYETAHTTEHVYYVTEATEAVAGTQTATATCACGEKLTVDSPSVYKDAEIGDVIGKNDNFRDNSSGDPLGRFSPMVYKTNSTNNGCVTQTLNTAGAIEQGTASATVMTACKNKSTNESYMSYLYGGAGVGYKIYAEKAGTVSVVVKAASGWLTSTGTWKTGDMQFNKVFSLSVNGNKIPVEDSAVLYGNKTGSSVYGEAMANWTYVAVTFNVVAGENDIQLVSCAPLKDGYEKRADGHIYAVGGTTALTTRSALKNAMLYFDPGDNGTQSTVQLDSMAFYDLNGAGLSATQA